MRNFQETIKKNNTNTKTLPNSFSSTNDEISLGKCILISLIVQPVIFFVIYGLVQIMSLAGIDIMAFNKPDMRVRDIEFVLVNKEAEPIDKNTRFRADRNSQAGGIHDPSKKVSEPSPAGPPKVKPTKQAQAPGGSKGKDKAPVGQKITQTKQNTNK